ncbi:MAG: hypothetical protein MAG794_00038 [Gammaproteobacteria bacterium]|nr:hypothetical protein [Gammaproteobacteria bacterium]
MNHQGQNSQTPRERTTVSQRHRRYPWLLLTALLILTGIAAAAPALVSTTWVREAALGWFNRSIPGEITVGDMSLSWLGGQSIRALVINDAKGQAVLTLEEFTTDLSLLEAMQNRLSLGQTVVHGLDADLKFDADGNNNLTAALGGTADKAPDEGNGLVVPVTGNMALIRARIAITAPDIEPIVLDNLSGALEMTGTETPIKLSFGGQSRQGSLQGSITLNAQVSDLFAGGTLNPGSAKINVDANIKDLPVDAMDQWLGLGGALSTALGGHATVYVNASGDAGRQNISVEARAPNGNLQLEGFVTDGRFGLLKPAAAQLQLTPALVEALHRVAPQDSSLRLATSVPLHLTIEQLDIPFDSAILPNISIQAELDARRPIQFVGIEELGELTITDLSMVVDSSSLGKEIRVTLNGKPVTRDKSGQLVFDAYIERMFDDTGNLQLDKLKVRAESSITGIPTSLVDTALGQNGLLITAVGRAFDINLEADTDTDGHVNISVNLDSMRLQTGPLRFSVNDYIVLSRPARIRFAVAPDLWRRLVGENANYQLAQAPEVTLDLNAFRIPVPAGKTLSFQPGQTQLHATLSTTNLVIHEAPDNPPTRVEDLKLELRGDALDKFELDGTARLVQTGGTLEWMDASPLRVTLEARSGLNPDVSFKEVASSIELDSVGLQAELDTTLDEGLTQLTLAGPAAIRAVITPALFAAGQDDDDPRATLREPVNVQASLDRLVAPLAPFSYTGLSAGGNVRADSLFIESTGNASTAIDNTRIAFEFEGKNRGRAKLDVNARVRPERKEPGNLSVDMTADNLLNAEGAFGGDTLSLELDGRLQQLPTALLDRLLNTDGLVTATLGAVADIELSVRLENTQGPVSLTLNAANTHADIKARIGNGGLTLTEPLVARIEPTPEFGQKVLAKINPIFETTQRAEQPVRFEVPADGMLIPIADYNFAKIAIPAMTIDFGKFILKSGWLLRGVIGLGQRFGKLKSVQRDEWVAWFTPAVLEVKNGRILYKRRLDLLLDQKLHLATWGGADVSRDRSALTLAFMPDTMERVFGISVAENDALHIPIEGPLSSPRMDFKKIAADLGRLRAKEEVAGENPLAGTLLGAVGGKITGGGGLVPPASVDPLPWTDSLEAQDTADREQKRTTGQSESERAPSTEEQVIKGLIDIFGNTKKE